MPSIFPISTTINSVKIRGKYSRPLLPKFSLIIFPIKPYIISENICRRPGTIAFWRMAREKKEIDSTAAIIIQSDELVKDKSTPATSNGTMGLIIN